MEVSEEDYLAHYGIRRKSGRYPWGSGQNPTQRSKTFLDTIAEHRRAGMSESQIAKLYNTKDDPFTSTDLRALKSISTNIQKQEKIRTAARLSEKGMGASAIARQMNLNESTVRSLLAPGRKDKLDVLQSTADMLKRQVEEKGFVDVGAQVQRDLPLGDNPETRIGISKDKFDTSLAILKEEGYRVHTLRIQQVGTGEYTKYKVLVKPGVEQKEVFLNRDKIKQISESTKDGGNTYDGVKPPLNISTKRIAVRYKEDGGSDADGVIYVRPGVNDVSLGGSRYAQVRIAVNGTHYLKGMAIYKDDLPAGTDLMFNTNKSKKDLGPDKLDAMKPLKDDPDNPFGAVIKPNGQLKDANGKVISAMNKINEEGDWDNWSRNLSSQMLSKQSPELAKTQLDMTFENRQKELKEIKSLTNPLIRKRLLETFSEETDSAAVHLKAAALPRQATKVLLPVNSVKPTEVFAPTFRDGERVVLVRFPHAGTFEIPELTVNNRNREARKLFGVGEGGLVPDAIGIHPKVAERLSGADFDGDSVVVIPNNRKSIINTPPLAGLKGFDPQAEFKAYDGMKTIDGGTYNAATKKVDYGVKADGTPRSPRKSTKEHEMGNITNLISDMTIRGANFDEVARAVRHSMVVIDSEKHNLDYKASAEQNGILSLKRRYQESKGNSPGGASTLLTRASSETRVNKRKGAAAGPGLARTSKGTVDINTGKKVWVDTGELKPDGKPATFKSKKLAETDDAFTLVSEGRGTPIEKTYAEHSNRLKKMANEARREAVTTKLTPYSPSAKKVYSREVDTLNASLNTALKNAPLERQAQVVANTWVAQKKRANPDMDGADLKKIKGQALTEARIRTGAGKTRIQLSDREWEAIQSGAISNHKLDQILSNTDLDKIRQRATPRENRVMTSIMTT
ncbi:MAG: helix-turn-helix domain-containing protein, partial [Ilumatobacteraceae bacterium]